MPLAPEPSDRHPVVKGLFLAALAMAIWTLVVMFGTDLTNYEFSNALRIGSGLIFVVGLVLVPWRPTRLLGIGIAVGAPLAYLLTEVILVIGLMYTLGGG